MKIHHCPQCQQHSLAHTGAFWACGSCGYAITQAALFLEHADTKVRNRRVPSGRQAGSNTAP